MSHLIGSTVLHTLLFVEMLLILPQLRLRRKSVGLWLLAAVLAVGVRVSFAPGSVARCAPVAFFFLAHGNYLAAMEARRFPWLWNVAAGGSFLIWTAAYPLGYAGSISHLLFTFLLLALAVVNLVPRLASAYRRTGAAALLALLASVPVALAAEAWDLFARRAGRSPVDAGLWSSFFLLFVIGLLLWKEGTSRVRPGQGRDASAEIRARLEQAEANLVLQNRLAATGTLAAGIAHEFKNILSQIQLCADFGLAAGDPAAKNKSLGMVKENVGSAKRSVTSLLDRLAARGREEVQAARLAPMLRLLQRSLNASHRVDRVEFTLELRGDPVATARPGEVEQIVLNLMRNAVEAYRRLPGSDSKVIHITAYARDAETIVEVRDRAGGVPEALQGILFDPPSLLKPGSLGLFLSRSLAERNDARLEHVPISRGSCFRLVLNGR